MSKRIVDLLEGEKEFECCLCHTTTENYFMQWTVSIPYEQAIVILFCSHGCEERAKKFLNLPEYSCKRVIRQMLKDAGSLEYPYKRQGE